MFSFGTCRNQTLLHPISSSGASTLPAELQRTCNTSPRPPRVMVPKQQPAPVECRVNIVNCVATPTILLPLLIPLPPKRLLDRSCSHGIGNKEVEYGHIGEQQHVLQRACHLRRRPSPQTTGARFLHLPELRDSEHSSSKRLDTYVLIHPSADRAAFAGLLTFHFACGFHDMPFPCGDMHCR